MQGRDIDWTEPFLEALKTRPVLSYAARVVNIDRTTAWRRMQADPAFKAAVEEAMEAGVDRAEAEAFRRAVDGYEELVLHQGHPTFLIERDDLGRPVLVDEEYDDFDAKGNPITRTRKVPKFVMDPTTNQPVPLTVRKHSDALLGLILKGRRKQVFAERIEQTGANGGPLAHGVIIATGVPREDDFSDLA